MSLNTLKQHFTDSNSGKLTKKYAFIGKLIDLLNERELSTETTDELNGYIDKMNHQQANEKIQRKALCRQQTALLRSIEKREHLVAKNHYRNTWLALGMSVFGIPIGVVIGTSLGSMSYIGYGISIGMIFGIIVGMLKDKAAAKNNKQLDIELQA